MESIPRESLFSRQVRGRVSMECTSLPHTHDRSGV